jgi:hypothetical protein
MRRTRTAPASALALLAALALGGCGHSAAEAGPDSKGEPSAGAVPRVLSTASLSYPLDSYVATDDQTDELGRAQNVLLSQCMKQYGFDYAPPEQPQPNGSSGPGRSLRYGLTDPAAAAAVGYRSQVTPPVKPAAPALSANEQLALHGPPGQNPRDLPRSWEEARAAMRKGEGSAAVDGQAIPAGGCVRESYLRLYAPKKGSVDIMFATDLAMDSFTRAEQDSRVVRAIGAWSSCMAAGGYHSTHPVSPQEDLGLDPGDYAGPEAIDAAKTDVACKEKADLVGVWYAVEVAYQKRAVEQNAERLAQAKAELGDRLKLAASLAG